MLRQEATKWLPMESFFRNLHPLPPRSSVLPLPKKTNAVLLSPNYPTPSYKSFQAIFRCRNFYSQKFKLTILHTTKLLWTQWRFPWWFKREVTVFLYFCLPAQLSELPFLRLHTLVFIYLSMLSHGKPDGGRLCLFAVWYLNCCSLKSPGWWTFMTFMECLPDSFIRPCY